MRLLYSFLFCLVLPFLPLRLYLRGRKNNDYNKRWHERFGLYNHKKFLQDSIWLHAVSLGETISVIPLIKNLLVKYPSTKIIVTTMTPTGFAKMRDTFGEKILLHYVPYDYPGAVKRFLNYANPSMLIIMETELWPNILYYAHQRHIPILLANARLSLRSFNRYKIVPRFVKKMLANITTIAAQSEADGERFLNLGFSKERLLITGNLKFDITLPDNLWEETAKLKQHFNLDNSSRVWIAASTHVGEEEKILFAARKISEAMPNVILILVPRHPERFNDVYNLCLEQGFNVVRYSDTTLKPYKNHAKCTIILGDVIGKLLHFYALASVAFVGGSFVTVGGHNLLEPAALGIPVLTGPNLANFKEISAVMLRAHAAEIVTDEQILASKIINLLQDDSSRIAMGEAGKKVIAENKGALTRILQWIAGNNLILK